MAIGINGSSNTITGIAVGGLPDGIVDTDMLAAGAVTAPKRGAGAILQVQVIKYLFLLMLLCGLLLVVTHLQTQNCTEELQVELK